MTMEKRNLVEEKRTPDAEYSRPDENWDKDAAAEMQLPVPDPVEPTKPEKE